MWNLRAYNTKTDELEGEYPLPSFPAKGANGAGASYTPYGSTHIPAASAKRLARQYGFVLPDGNDVAYFVDFDVEPEREPRKGIPSGRSGLPS